jgi:hypothetical protein
MCPFLTVNVFPYMYISITQIHFILYMQSVIELLRFPVYTFDSMFKLLCRCRLCFVNKPILCYFFQSPKFTYQFPFLLQLLLTDGFAKENM